MLQRSILHGVISAFMAILLLMLLAYIALEELPELAGLQDPVMLLILVTGIFFLGILISWLSTWFAVRKYLRIQTDLLYT
jgi:cell division transport system permease protein